MANAASRILGNSRFGMAGAALSKVANDNAVVANDNDPRPVSANDNDQPVNTPSTPRSANDNDSIAANDNVRIKPESKITSESTDKLLQTAVHLLHRIDNNIEDQLEIEKSDELKNRERFLEAPHPISSAPEHEKGSLNTKSSEKSSMAGMIGMIARGIGPALLTMLPAILGGLGIATGVGLLGKAAYDHSDDIKRGASYVGETVGKGYDVAKGAAGRAISSVGKSLGFVSEKYESGGRGVGTISNGKGDPGGKSYGKYQLASKTGTLNTYLKKSGYSKQFAGMDIGGKEFDAKWKYLAKNDKNFEESQHDFIAKTHYLPAINHAAKLGFPVDDRRVQEMIWSGSVQHGGIKKILTNVAKHVDVRRAPAEDIIRQYYKDRKTYAVSAISRNGGSAKQISSVAKRMDNESRDILSVKQSAPNPAGKLQTAVAPDRSKILTNSDKNKAHAAIVSAAKAGNKTAIKALREEAAGKTRTSQEVPPRGTNTPSSKPMPLKIASSADLATPLPGRAGSDVGYNWYFGSPNKVG